MSSKRTLLVLALMLAPLLATQSSYVTWDGLVKFIAVYSGVTTFINMIINLSPVYGAAALFLALIGAVIAAFIVYIFAKIAAGIVS